MEGNTVLHAKAAQSESNKFSSLTQKVVRRLLHTSSSVHGSHGMENLERFSCKMINSGHKQHYVQKVVTAGIMKFKKKLNKSILPKTHKDYKPLHLGTHYDSHGRWKRKVQSRTNWYEDKAKEEQSDHEKRAFQKDGKMGKKTFQKDGNKVKTSTVVFVPATKRGKLTEMLKEKEEEMARLTKFRIRFQEAGGIKLGQLFSTHLGAGGPCGRLDCQPCESRDEKRPNCKAQSILYESKCNICNKDETSSRQEEKGQRKGIYIGESSRSLYERSKEHLKDAEDFSPSSHMVKHWMHAHEEMKTCPDFSFTILSRFRDCLSRQVAKAIQILYTKDQNHPQETNERQINAHGSWSCNEEDENHPEG